MRGQAPYVDPTPQKVEVNCPTGPRGSAAPAQTTLRELTPLPQAANPLVGGDGLAVASPRTPSRSRPFGPCLSYPTPKLVPTPLPISVLHLFIFQFRLKLGSIHACGEVPQSNGQLRVRWYRPAPPTRACYLLSDRTQKEIEFSWRDSSEISIHPCVRCS